MEMGITVSLVLLVVLSGCTTDVTDGTGTTSVTDVSGTGDVTDGTETTEKPTDAPATPTDSVYDLPLSTDELLDEHSSVLRSAGSFTSVEYTHFSHPESGAERWINTTTRAEVGTGELHRYQNWSKTGYENRGGTGDSRLSQTYIDPSGEGYYRQSYGSEFAVSYSRAPSSVNVSKHLRPDITSYLEQGNVEYEGVRTISGTRTHVYAVPEVAGFEADSEGRNLGFDSENLNTASLRLFITDDGLMKRFEMNVSVTTESGPMRAQLRSTYYHLGETTVEEPTWLAEAKEEVTAMTEPDPAETVTEEIRDSSLGVTVTVTAPRYALEYVNLERQSGGIWDTGGDGYQNAKVSSLVMIRTPDEASIDELALSYDDSAFSGEESGVAIFRYDEELQTFVQVETDVDARANVAYADIDRDGVYLVMHVETWRSSFE